MAVLRDYERVLAERFLAGLPDDVASTGRRRWRAACRPSSSTSTGVEAETAARALAERGIGVWYAGNWYCVGLADRLPRASLRIGFIHYNTAGEVDRLLDELASIG